ncbi:MAG TPA: transposase [Candidatus Acidoferrales bacterium]|jgi:transposase-like protein|nr:transposase [Candidatus Acidoferrales bacterium]
MPTVLRVGKSVKSQDGNRADLPEDLSVRVPLIQALIPLGLEAVAELLQQDVAALVGPPYARDRRPPGLHRWTCQAGSIYLADQKLRILRPRVRNRRTREEVPLPTYGHLQQPRAADEGVLRRILHGLSCRDYRACAEAAPEAFGLSASTMSRRYIRVSARKLQVLQERRLDSYEFVALVLDGKAFQDDTLVVALGITVRGEKVLLGFVETGTENETTCAEFLRGLVERGLRYEGGLLVMIDGGKGLRAGVRRVFGPQTPVQRCQWHKRENVVAYLPKAQQALWRGKLQQAYAQPTYAEAKAALEGIRRELKQINESAARSLDEGLEETLTLHRLGVGPTLRQHLATTNGLESIFAQVEQWTGKVDRWQNSNQKHRWLAAALLDIEPRLRRLRGYRSLPQLREALQEERQRARTSARSAA